MGQQSLIYSFVARGTVILSEYTEFTGNFTSIAAQCLQKLPATNNKFTYNCDGHTFIYLVADGFTYCVVGVESVGRQVPMAFLERAKEDFTKKYGGGKAATAVANSLNKEFGPKLKEQMQYCVDHPEEISKLAKVKAQVSEVKGVMMENIEKVLDRGEKIELLVDKTENLRSQEFGRDTNRLDYFKVSAFDVSGDDHLTGIDSDGGGTTDHRPERDSSRVVAGGGIRQRPVAISTTGEGGGNRTRELPVGIFGVDNGGETVVQRWPVVVVKRQEEGTVVVPVVMVAGVGVMMMVMAIVMVALLTWYR